VSSQVTGGFMPDIHDQYEEARFLGFTHEEALELVLEDEPDYKPEIIPGDQLDLDNDW
jgi:hypothetical protein